jgi:hypothetical protein
MKKLLILIFVAAALSVRLVKLDQVPPHLSSDEISIAFDAYSLVHTGRDEHAIAFPVSLTSLGNYKAPLYAYLLAPLTLVFGNSDLTAKLPSVISGILAVLIIFHISYLLSRNFKVAFFSSFILAVTPWHIYTSRMVLETNLALLFMSLGLILFLTDSHLLSAVCLSLSLYAYHTQWGLVPLLATFMFFSLLPRQPKSALKFLIVFLLFTVPLFTDYLQHSGTSARANVEVIWHDPASNTPLSFTKTFISNYFSYTNPGYLFFTGLGLFPNPHPFQSGLFVWPLIIPFFTGLFHLKKYISKRHVNFFIFWTMVSPVVPALTHGGPSLIRNLPSILPYTIIIALGLYHLLTTRLAAFMFTVLVCLLSTIYYLLIYFYHFPVATAATYQGYKPVITYLRSHALEFTQVKIDNRFGIDNQFISVPHLYLAYYYPLSPRLVQHRQETSAGTYFSHRYFVTPINWAVEAPDNSTWYVVGTGHRPPPSVAPQLDLIASFPDTSGRPAFEIWSGVNNPLK